MNKSLIRHILVVLSTILGVIPSTKVLVPIIESLSNNLDNIYTQATGLLLSLAAVWASFKYGRTSGGGTDPTAPY
ncbi:MAG: hypothetical protein K1X68_13585 [Saprospiraceae bacterium]|nr:hypothetical protein [Saprospiraceae bacterium]HMW39283.1 hypothetical protein [Saprospiraceae bacterium]HMX89083.1 hypothetical protein [Saprospiraceae bacterium]HMZ40954.1 hypothetical protein [Saprospiraceae bacterium]HNB30435.1 hypothetical protein [Saprospiraceae bacterium]